MKKIVTIVENEIHLNSGLGEAAFGKTHNNDVITQEGVLFDGKNFKSWTFEEVRSYNEEGRDERTVFYCGKNPLTTESKSLADYFEIGGEDLFKAAKTVIFAMTEAAKHKHKLPVIGAGGILIDLSAENSQVLFIPENLYKYACNGLSKEDYLESHGGWINQTIFDLPALCFERAVIAYRLLTGRFPYPSTDSLERNADILDRKFLPVELCVNGINPALSNEINKALKLNSSAVTLPGKKQKGKSSEDLTPAEDFPIDLLDDAWKISNTKTADNDKEFEEKVANYIRMRDSKINLKRNVRRNSSMIIIGIVAAIVLVVVAINTVKANLDEYTSKGLTSVQTIQAFFHGVNTKDTVLLSNFSTGKQAQGFTDSVSRVYVMDKQRLAYNHDNGFATPEQWILYITNEERYAKSGLYGITSLKIDGKPYDTEVTLFKRNQKPEALTKEGNITLTNGSESVHKVEYYLLRTDGEVDDFVIEKISETIFLTYQKDRWIITDLQTETSELKVDCKTFKKDYFAALEENENDTIKAVRAIKNKYFWLPSEKDIQAERDRIQYKIEHPMDAFGL